MCPLVTTTRTTTSPKRLGKSEPVNDPPAAGEGEGVGAADGVAEGPPAEGVASGLGDGVIIGTAATAPSECGDTL